MLSAGPEAECWEWTVFSGVCPPERRLAAHADVFPSFGRNPPVGWARGGDSEEQIRAFLIRRYGDFILLKPPFKSETWLLWGAPFLILIGGRGGDPVRKAAAIAVCLGKRLDGGRTRQARHFARRRRIVRNFWSNYCKCRSYQNVSRETFWYD
ncbi:hypothetical protein CU048_13675 [Beijerinckiaceae bacterium]|nr:hypothetical protein CU048_13675 [Beijerinckiaceae bacterium]